jgi:hypothetical protein
MMGEPAAIFRGIFAVAALAVIALAPASASSQNLRQGLFGRPSDGREFNTPPVARYVSESGERFILDRSQGRPLLKFENSPEVWVLQPHPAPRGDMIYKNDLGQPVLRATRLGGVTIFTQRRPAGAAAAMAGPGPPLRLPAMGPQELSERLLQASARATRAARHPVLFEAEATPASSAVIADAATVASVAIAKLAGHPAGAAFLARLRRVLLIEGRKPSAQVQNETLVIVVAPTQGAAGRPSSERILAVAARLP